MPSVEHRTRAAWGAHWRDVFYEVAASAEVRFHPDDWQIRYSKTNLSESDYLSSIVWQLRSRSRGRNVAFEVDDLQAATDRLAADGYGLVGGVGQYEHIWRTA